MVPRQLRSQSVKNSNRQCHTAILEVFPNSPRWKRSVEYVWTSLEARRLRIMSHLFTRFQLLSKICIPLGGIFFRVKW
ncbi:hypothetical protein BDA96_09G040600 [Sorghum bicolor]|uniref:Uncharacterized protein n=2 Tax=Sorghum bicolor TaxID=4558 RepID=A0A1B6P7K7_SORBI|nr:hypothetical protein BDA96_09G040600 [Sorghum bicolor]KAG0516882.1 hypothetical protein BDA96_09G040600 [Sorghum bicolor]KXG21720.1 hypothetical protein SORBI_3009G099600 [Sorghum bicolor]OQU77771.1 hypothetical protein SORBI_3009G099600 [Sorghum bicolor]